MSSWDVPLCQAMIWRLGGLGLRSAMRTSLVAYFASWLDTLPVLAVKDERLAQHVVDTLGNYTSDFPCLAELDAARNLALGAGAEGLLTWPESLTRHVPPAVTETDAGEFCKGWQCYISSIVEHRFMKDVVLPCCCDARCAMLLSQSGPGAGAWLSAMPIHSAVQISSLRMQVALCRRLR